MVLIDNFNSIHRKESVECFNVKELIPRINRVQGPYLRSLWTVFFFLLSYSPSAYREGH